jgi:hypothetical protein
MTVVLTLLRVLLQTLINAGVAFDQGRRHAQARQRQTDQEAAADAIEARQTVSTDRSELVDELRESGNLRD